MVPDTPPPTYDELMDNIADQQDAELERSGAGEESERRRHSEEEEEDDDDVASVRNTEKVEPQIATATLIPPTEVVVTRGVIVEKAAMAERTPHGKSKEKKIVFTLV